MTICFLLQPHELPQPMEGMFSFGGSCYSIESQFSLSVRPLVGQGLTADRLTHSNGAQWLEEIMCGTLSKTEASASGEVEAGSQHNAGFPMTAFYLWDPEFRTETLH